jgi:hypothetical protein
MFVGYPSEGQTMDAFLDELKQMAAKMFFHEGVSPNWNSSVLPPHKGIDTETGNLFSAVNGEMSVQVAIYIRQDKELAYGYFAMKDKKKDDAKFLDAKGNGLKAFDELARSIGPSKTDSH